MLKARLIDELRKRQAELFALCSRLVQIPSENPPGDTDAARVLHHATTSPSLRIPVEWHEPMAGRPNLVATPRLGRAQSRAVGAPRRVSRGAGVDAAAVFRRHRGRAHLGARRRRHEGGPRRRAHHRRRCCASSTGPLAGRLTLAFASDEETGGTWGTQWLLANVPAVRGDACLIGESSGTWSAGIGEKGVLWLRLRGQRRVGPRRVPAGPERGGGGARRPRAPSRRLQGRRGRADRAVSGGHRRPAPRRRAPLGPRHRAPRRHGGGERGDARGRRPGQPDPRGRDGRGGLPRAAGADDGRRSSARRAGGSRARRAAPWRWTCSTSAIRT